jgi:DNA primase
LGLCPLHPDHQPSFLIDPSKNLFYCYGCGRGGDVIRLAELYHGVRFAEAMALLRDWSGLGSLLPDVAKFYQLHLHRHAEAAA